MRARTVVEALLALVVILAPGLRVSAQDPCQGNQVANAAMEEGARGTGGLGTQAGSIVANAWTPWSVWGDSAYKQEAQFDIEDRTKVGRYTMYRVHSGIYSQKVGTNGAVHTGGIFQRIAVPKGSTVKFSIWVQIYTGQQSIVSDANQELISDLNSPGNYRAWIGVDPYGDTPAGFGAQPSERTVWSGPVLDRETRQFTSNGLPFDAWVQLEVQVTAAADHVTVYTKGEPEFPTAINVSYWDDACLTYKAPVAAPTKAPAVTATAAPTATRVPTVAPTTVPTTAPSVTSTATEVPTAAVTLEPTAVSSATPTLRPSATATSRPTSAPAATMTATKPAASKPRADGDDSGLLAFFGAVWLAGAGYLGWTLWKRRQESLGH